MKPLELPISELCPNGVEYIKIGNFAIQMNGMSGVSNKWKDTGNCRFIDYMNVYKNISVNVEDLPFATVKSLAKQTILKKGDILFTSASETPLECAISSNIEGELPDGILLDDHLFAIRIKTEWKNKISPSFIKYLFRAAPMRVIINKAVRGVTRFYISKKDFMELEIPIPPIAIQEKIVEYLDNFTALTAELQAELQARQQQYEYYRNHLLSFGGSNNTHSESTDTQQFTPQLQVVENE